MALFVRLAVILLVSWNFAFAESSPYDHATCKATSTPTMLTFAFPISKTFEYEWYQEKTKDSYLEFAWEIALEGQDDPRYKYKFGLYLFKFPGSSPKKGNIDKLVQSGQVSVWDLSTGRMNDNVKIRVVAVDDQLIIEANDETSIAALTSGNPVTAHCRVLTPYDDLNFQVTVPIIFE